MSSPSLQPHLPLVRKQIEILVVEANPADTNLTKIAFKAAGLTTGFRSVSDGEDALAYVRKQGKYANVPTPDMIFLDLSLPKVSGLDVLKAIKSTPHSQKNLAGARLQPGIRIRSRLTPRQRVLQLAVLGGTVSKLLQDLDLVGGRGFEPRTSCL